MHHFSLDVGDPNDFVDRRTGSLIKLAKKDAVPTQGARQKAVLTEFSFRHKTFDQRMGDQPQFGLPF